jgi:2-oxo-3-hexenedioate decarboxylase
MADFSATVLAREILEAYAARRVIPPPGGRGSGFDLNAAYSVSSEIARLRRAAGRSITGLKVGYANKAVWRALKLDTLVWGPMYDDTVHFATGNALSLPVGGMHSPKIEPEIVFKLKRPLAGGAADAAAALDAVEWLALGFEIIDCVFPDWKLQPADFVASKGLHAGLVVGGPLPMQPARIPALVEALARFTVTLFKDGQVAAEGSGRNALRSPALCLAELATAVAERPGTGSLEAGALISSGTLTDSQPMAAGETWTATVEGLELPSLTIHLR